MTARRFSRELPVSYAWIQQHQWQARRRRVVVLCELVHRCGLRVVWPLATCASDVGVRGGRGGEREGQSRATAMLLRSAHLAGFELRPPEQRLKAHVTVGVRILQQDLRF